MKITSLLAILALLAGCATFHPEALDPSATARAFESRTLSDNGLKAYLEQNLHRTISPWPPASWDLIMLTLASFYYNPDLDRARAAWEVKQAGIITAGQRPNPGAGFTPQYHANPRGLDPWTLSFFLDIPVETAGKRGYRIARANSLSEAARMEIANTAWQVRSRLRRNFLSLYGLTQREQLLKHELSLEEKIVRIFRKRLTAGESSRFVLTNSVIAMDKTSLALSRTLKEKAQGRVSLAGAIGLPPAAVDGIDISFKSMEKVDADLYSPDVSREALLNRADILAKLSEYAAAQAELQLQIARQYPDIHLGPAYAWDQGDNEWSLGAALILPVLNRNEGPIAEARARRKEKAAEFMALQARVVEDTNGAVDGYKASLKTLKTADSLLTRQKRNYEASQARFGAGQTDRLAVVEAELEFITAKLSRLEALLIAQTAVGQLEDAVQKPLNTMDAFPAGSIAGKAER